MLTRLSELEQCLSEYSSSYFFSVDINIKLTVRTKVRVIGPIATYSFLVMFTHFLWSYPWHDPPYSKLTVSREVRNEACGLNFRCSYAMWLNLAESWIFQFYSKYWLCYTRKLGNLRKSLRFSESLNLEWIRISYRRHFSELHAKPRCSIIRIMAALLVISSQIRHTLASLDAL